MRILALDHGTVRIGVAVSDELKMIASPLEYIPAEPVDAFMDRLKALLKEKDAASKERLERLEAELADLKESSSEMKVQWQNEKDVIQDLLHHTMLGDESNEQDPTGRCGAQSTEGV